MSTTQHLGVALCYDTPRLQFYNSACHTVSPLGNYGKYVTGVSRRFNCFGAAMGFFYDKLVAGGETNACVCTFYSPDGGDTVPWEFVTHYGPCNGACVSQTFTCNGLKPVPHNGVEEKVKREDNLLSADESVYEEQHLSGLAKRSEADTATAASSGAALLEVAGAVNWKAAVFVATIILCNAFL
ncbi:hypothetical protein A1O7_03504 [Cladophialophora yegresii CBS 114405]|uniref:Uncharacterized protein n=1 Tax=Cladophialophora yegresii CBS 114405 TaxID=1182544 RepID=W9WXR4_9EURO|nr:uncharacterized protein A1O7_03504 [Cladophialophora yegresii CBS 114405]EXJ63059.1 hypothetical protein A1O7_03504 [Cladophialophora yegresii CBS 114405]